MYTCIFNYVPDSVIAFCCLSQEISNVFSGYRSWSGPALTVRELIWDLISVTSQRTRVHKRCRPTKVILYSVVLWHTSLHLPLRHDPVGFHFSSVLVLVMFLDETHNQDFEAEWNTQCALSPQNTRVFNPVKECTDHNSLIVFAVCKSCLILHRLYSDCIHQ